MRVQFAPDHECEVGDDTRADHLMTCEHCTLEYWRHPYCSNQLDWEGLPFLHVLCNGDHVKL